MHPKHDERASAPDPSRSSPGLGASQASPSDFEGRKSYIRELSASPFFEEMGPSTGVRAASPKSTLAADAAARRLVEALVARGVDTFFGIPGGPICPVFEAIRLTPGARLIESRHESHAAFAATLYHRASGRIPAVVVTAGPGITNAVTGIASASLERTPMLVIAGDVAWASSGRRLAQDSGPEGLAMERMLSPITRIQVRAAHARSVVSQALAALDVATQPVRIGLPNCPKQPGSAREAAREVP